MTTPAAIRCVVEPAAAEELVPLRHAILRQSMPIDAARFPGDLEQSTLHLCARLDGRVVACASFMAMTFEDQPAYQLRGMATDPLVRGGGVGARLLRRGESELAARGVGLLWCNARCSAVGFYARQGWRVVSAEFDIPTAGPHVRMTTTPHR